MIAPVLVSAHIGMVLVTKGLCLPIQRYFCPVNDYEGKADHSKGFRNANIGINRPSFRDN